MGPPKRGTKKYKTYLEGQKIRRQKARAKVSQEKADVMELNMQQRVPAQGEHISGRASVCLVSRIRQVLQRDEIYKTSFSGTLLCQAT